MTLDLGLPAASEARSMPTAAAPHAAGDSDPAALLERYRTVRAFTEWLCEPLAVEDYVIQTMPDVSPTKWHLAHTTWFFETFLLQAHAPGYEVLHPKYNYLFNSYYNAVGYRHCRPKRGLISRPTVSEVYDYRRYVDRAVSRTLGRLGEDALERIVPVLELGLHHEQQHQELMITDLKHVFSENPLFPAYRERPSEPARMRRPCAGWPTMVGCPGPATRGPASISTTKPRATGPGWSPSSSPRAW